LSSDSEDSEMSSMVENQQASNDPGAWILIS
jgi:hypothetical protein